MNKLIVLSGLVITLIVPSAAMAGPQQERMRSCNKEAKSQSLKGDERKAFMKSCLRNKKSGDAGGGKSAPAEAKK